MTSPSSYEWTRQRRADVRIPGDRFGKIASRGFDRATVAGCMVGATFAARGVDLDELARIARAWK